MASRAKRAPAPARPLLLQRGRPSHGQPREAGASAGATPPPPTRSALTWPAARSGRPAPARPLLLQRGRPSHGQPREAGAALTVGGYATEMQLSDSERASGR